jgi:hypothetical protein
MPTATIEHLSPLDPISYIRRVGLRPEDTYGFIPTKLEEGAEMLYLYRDRPEYEQARSVPDTGPRVPMMAPEAPGGPFADLIQQAQELQRAYGGGQAPAFGAPGDPLPAMPDPEKLVEAAKLRASGAIDDAEYARLRAQAGAPDPNWGAAPQPATPVGEGPEIVAHRIYPGLRSRSSVEQLDEFLPSYGRTVGLRPEDVYGVFPWGSRSRTGADTSEAQWDDYWVVYRDRPEYADGREAYARAMDDSGRWPPPVTAPGVGEPTGAAGPAAEVQVADELWPRSMLIIKQTGGQLADWLKQKIADRGYEPEDSYGFCPSFTQRSIYFGWRRR